MAQKAGVAKGTLYLYFPDKESLFEQLLLSFAEPVLSRLSAIAADDGRPANLVLDQILNFIHGEVLGSDRARILRLVISEGPRFPRIAEFYHRELICRGREIIRSIAQRGVDRGELASSVLTRFPQLFFAPILLAVIWEGLFSKIDPLDTRAMIAEYSKIMLSPKTDGEAGANP